MRRIHWAVVAAAIVLESTARHGNAGERFTVGPFDVSARCESSGRLTTNTEAHVFKLDTAVGSVWRLTTNGFALIAAQDLVSEKGVTEGKLTDIRKRLKEITIPTVDYQGEALTNILASLQEAVRLRDPSVSAGSKDSLRLTIRGTFPPDFFPAVTFHAQDISALE